MLIKLYLGFGTLLPCILLGGCATLENLAATKYECALSSDGTHLALSGPTDEKMLACVEENISPRLKAVTVNTNGGNVKTAMKTADLLAPNNVTLTVKSNCNSSCANYFLPVAGRIIVQKNANIMLHGSIDEGFVQRVATQRGQRPVPASAKDIEQQQKEFVEKYDVDLGWLMYRTAAQYDSKSASDYLTGEPEVWGADNAKIRSYIAEEDFIRSCLRDVQIDPFEDTIAQQVYDSKKLQSRLAKQGIYPSGSMRCLGADAEGAP